MNAQTKFASRFTMPADPMEMLRLLQGMTAEGGPIDGLGPDTDGDEFAPDQSASDAPKEAAHHAAAGESAAEPKPGHDGRGRFAKGNQCGTGNPFARQVAALRKQLLDSVTPFVFQQAIEALVLQACKGDVAALKLFFQYTLGKPAEAKDPDRVALEEAELLRASNSSGRQWRDLCGAPFLETVMEQCRWLQMLVTERFEGRFMAGASGVAAAQEKEREQSAARRARAEARRAQKAAEAAGAAEVGAASRAAPNPAGPGEQPAAEAPSPNGAGGAMQEHPTPRSGSARLAEPTQPAAATAPSANAPIGSVPESQASAATPQPRDVAAAAAATPAGDSNPSAMNPAVNPAVNPAAAADRGKTKAPPSTNGADGQPAAPPKSVPGIPRSARSSKRKTRAA